MCKTYSISFLVPTLGSRDKEIERLLESLIKQSYQNFEVIFVAQDNFDKMENIRLVYSNRLDITLVKSEEKGVSKSRNKGMPYCKGDIVVLSDDDCWYPVSTAANIAKAFEQENISVLLTQIYDYDNEREYKAYSRKEQIINSSFKLLSKSSVEIAFMKSIEREVYFDELFGLGARFVCGEEVDFLLRLFKNNNIVKYKPIVTAYHEKKYSGSTKNQIIAKGAVYSKNYNVLIGFMVCLKDLLLHGEMNFKPFFEGFSEYKVYKRGN